MKITEEMINPSPRNLLQELYDQQVKALDQDETCLMYTGRSWFDDLSYTWAAQAALMCDADQIDFGDPLLAPLGVCDHPYDISKPCALRTWQHYKPTDEELAQWWEAQRG